MKNKCIVSLGTPDYNLGRERLRKSLVQHAPGVSIYLFTKEHQVGAPVHHENPYAFKIYTIQLARELGFEQILWVDCSVWAIKDISPVFDIIEEDGYICQEAGHKVGRWTNDRALNYFGINRDEAMKIDMYGNAGLLGLDFTNPIAVEFFDKWKASMEAGMFKGYWKNNDHTESWDLRCDGHRHDMSCGSVIRHNLGMKMQSGNEILQYVNSPVELPNNEKVYFFAQGLRG